MLTVEERDAQLAAVGVILGGDGELTAGFSLISNRAARKGTPF